MGLIPTILWKNGKPYIKSDGHKKRLTWAPHPGAQMKFLSSTNRKLVYMGDRGVGSTEALVMDFLQHVGDGHGTSWRGLIARNTLPGLHDLKHRVGNLVAMLFVDAVYQPAGERWLFADGATLQFEHYLGVKPLTDKFCGCATYPWMGFDRVTESANSRFFDTVVGFNQTDRDGIPVRLRATGHTADPGFGWVTNVFQPKGIITGHFTENLTMMYERPNFHESMQGA